MNDQQLQLLLASRLRVSADVTVTPALIRQEHWMIVKNPMSGAHVRLHHKLWSAVCELDGTINLNQWLIRHTPDHGEQQLISAVVQLQRQGMLSSEGAFDQSQSISTTVFVRRNPLMLRFALLNPTRVLDVLCRCSSALPPGMLLLAGLLIVMSALTCLVMETSAIAAFWQRYPATIQVWHFLVLFPLTKCLHELAHGWALRHLGGEVPEAGITFIVLFPMPYVDATDAWSLPKRHRMMVTSAGMAMDLILACSGLLLWSYLSPGMIATMAFTVALMGGVSILLFNANPLLKFDGYYLLEDAIDSPGLARRSNTFMQYLFKRYLLMLKASVPPAVAGGERGWLLAYACASTAYRFVLAAIICTYLITTLHELGVLLSLFSLIPLCVLPVIRFLRFMASSAELETVRLRAVCVVSLLITCIAGFVLSVPIHSSTRTQGVVWVNEQAQVYASQSGIVDDILVGNGESVDQGQVLISLASPELKLDLEQKLAGVRLARIAVERYRQNDPGKASTKRIALKQAQNELEYAMSQVQNLTITAPVAGRFVVSSDLLTHGARVLQGDLLAYVVNNNDRVVRAVVEQQALGQVNADVQGVNVRLAQDIGKTLPARITRQYPSGSHQLPSTALANTGFGGFEVVPDNDQQLSQTREKVFHLELEILDSTHRSQPMAMGTRAFVTLEHSPEPLAYRWLRLSRQLLLTHLSV